MKHAVAGVICFVALMHASVRGQDARAFEVASIKQNNAGNEGPRFLSPVPGGLQVVNLPVQTLVWMAYQVQSYQVVGAPDWATTQGYDVEAKAPEGAIVSMDSFRPMLQKLLADRFQLKVRRETRELPVYNLVRVRKEGPLGPKMKQASVDCTAAPGPNNAGGPPANCGAFIRPGGLSVSGMPIRTLTRLLAITANRVIVDRTQLEGPWDLEVDFTPDLAAAPGAPPAGASADSPNLFTALHEQLGLKLEADRGPVEVIVIESVSRPTEN